MKSCRVILFLIAVAVVVGGVLVWSHASGGTMRTLKVYVHEPMREVLSANPRSDYKPEVQTDESPIIWPENDTSGDIFDFTYGGPDGVVHLPHARMVWATQYTGIVTDVLVSASANKLVLPAFYTELKDVADQLTRAGWHANTPLPALDTIQRSVAASDATGLEGGVLTYSKGTVTVRVNFHQPSEVKACEVSSLCGHWTPSPFVRLETPYPSFWIVSAGNARVIVSLD